MQYCSSKTCASDCSARTELTDSNHLVIDTQVPSPSTLADSIISGGMLPSYQRRLIDSQEPTMGSEVIFKDNVIAALHQSNITVANHIIVEWDTDKRGYRAYTCLGCDWGITHAATDDPDRLALSEGYAMADAILADCDEEYNYSATYDDGTLNIDVTADTTTLNRIDQTITVGDSK